MCPSDTIVIVSKPAKNHEEPEVSYFDTLVGACIEKVMKLRGLNHYKLADKSGIGRPHITNLINGRRRANMDTIEALSKALAVPAAALIPGGERLLSVAPGTSLPDGSWGIVVTNSEADHVALIVNGLDKPERERILHYARAVEAEAEGKGRAEETRGPSLPRQSKPAAGPQT